MAERSGIPRIDSLIEQFAREGVVYLTGSDRDAPVAEWRTCTAENGFCHGISESFVELLAEAGIQASLSDECELDGETSQFAELPETPAAMGYSDRPLAGASWHVAAIVSHEQRIFLVDWSAAQFGYSEFPLVQQLGPDGRWQRQW